MAKRAALQTREKSLRLYSPSGDEPTPFLKWAGGKTQLLPVLERFFVDSIGSYMEPFVGGGAVFFFLRGRGWLKGDVLLADINEELINAYKAVKTNVDDVLELLEKHQRRHSEDYFYNMRSKAFTIGPAGAARTIYLNKTAFNGLFRVNCRGQFNVPIGDYKNPTICDEVGLRRASKALRGVKLKVQCFRKTIETAAQGDLLYIDPPYVPVSATSSFTGYTARGFSQRDQEDLAERVTSADRRGAYFVLSNSYTPKVHELYRGFRIEREPAKRMINCNGAKRGPISEAIVLNYRRDGDVVERISPRTEECLERKRLSQAASH